MLSRPIPSLGGIGETVCETLAAGGTGQLAVLLDSPELGRLIRDLEETRLTGRPGYPIRTMIGLALAKSALESQE